MGRIAGMLAAAFCASGNCAAPVPAERGLHEQRKEGLTVVLLGSLSSLPCHTENLSKSLQDHVLHNVHVKSARQCPPFRVLHIVAKFKITLYVAISKTLQLVSNSPENT